MNEEELKYHIALQEVYKEKTGRWQWYDRWHDPADGEEGVVMPGQLKSFRRGDFSSYILIPFTIDPYNEDRGLLKMINNLMEINKYSKTWEVWTYDETAQVNRYVASTLTLALLKALANQEGVEV